MDKAVPPALALLDFERRVRACSSNREVAFRAVNESANALEFDQAVIWRLGPFGHPAIVAASGLADVSTDSPYQQWLGRLVRSVVPEPFAAPLAVEREQLPQALAEEGAEWDVAHMFLCPLIGGNGEAMGGIAFFRGRPFTAAESAAAEWIAQATSFGLWAWRKDRIRLSRWFRSRRVKTAVAGSVIALAALGLIPVNLSALAPAEITPMRPIPVTSPLDGVVREVLVKPNQVVKAGEALALLDDTAIRNRLAVAEKAHDIARADLQRATYKSFADESSRMELQVLDARVREKVAEVGYLSELLGKLRITAPQGGVTVFADAEDWRGKPVQVGERIMTIADPSLIDVSIYLSPEDAVALETGGDVTLFLHIDPLNSLKAKITRANYEAQLSPDGTLAYLVRADLVPGHGFPRIGSRGTAKVHGGSVRLAFYLFRKPLAFLRKSLGI
jgi:hypothetical protein